MTQNVQRKSRWLPFWLLACMMTLGATSAWAKDWTLNLNGEGGGTITDGSSILKVSVNQSERTIKIGDNYDTSTTAAELIIPSEATGGGMIFKVTSIVANAFQQAKSIKSVTIPNTVTEIGDKAFKECYFLKTVVFEEGGTLEAIPTGMFYDCNGLKDVTLPEGLKTIGVSAFLFCSAMTGITIPTTVTTIKSSAFSECDGLASIELPNSVTTLGTSVFYICFGLTSATLPDKITEIPPGIFDSCPLLESITIPASVETIGDGAFAECAKLTSITYMGGTEPTIGNGAFNSNGSDKPLSGRKLILTNAKPGSEWHPEKWCVDGMDNIEYSSSNKFDPVAHTLTLGETVIQNVTASGDKLTIG
ncbi:leucine-rich repeat domain-containing protein, partial [Parabacteroides sp.]